MEDVEKKELMEVKEYFPGDLIIPEKIVQTSDVTYLSKLMSKHFHEKSLTPDYYITGFKDYGRIWDIIEMDDPVKDIQYFLPNCRFNDKIKKNIYWKAERAGQSILLCQLLANYFFNKKNSNSLFYNKHPITDVYILPITTKDHKSPIFDDERKVLSSKETFNIIHLRYIDDDHYIKDVYIDLCATQVDITSYDSDGYPLYIFEKLQLGELYGESFNKDTRIVNIGPEIHIINDTAYQNYLEAVCNEFMEEVQEYVIHLYTSYKDIIRKKIKNKRRNKSRSH